MRPAHVATAKLREQVLRLRLFLVRVQEIPIGTDLVKPIGPRHPNMADCQALDLDGFLGPVKTVFAEIPVVPPKQSSAT